METSNEKKKTVKGEINFLENGVLGLALLETRRAKKNGLFPVKYRLTYKRKQIYINAGYDFNVSDWKALQDAKENQKLHKKRKAIIAGLDRIKAAINEIAQTSEYSHEKLIKLTKKGRTDNLQDAFDAIIMELNKNGQVGSAGVYRNTIKSLTNFKKDLKFKDITCKWLKDYQKQVENDLSSTTIGIYLRTLRAVFNRAIADKVIPYSSYPFSRTDNDGGYKIQTGTGSKIALTLDQMALLINYTPKTIGHKRSRDLFLLSFHLGGINFKDMLLLKWTDYKNGEITFIREKTKRTTKNKEVKITIPVTDAAKTLIDELGDPKGIYILPYMKPDAIPSEVLKVQQNVTRLTNKHLSVMGKDLKIDGISTYVARHSLATILKNSGVPVAFISETLGHSNVQTTQAYLQGFEKEQRAKNFEILNNIGK